MWVTLVSVIAVSLCGNMVLAQIRKNSVEYTIIEEPGSKQRIGNPAREAKIASADTNIKYSFLDADKPQLIYFRISPVTGDLFTRASIDREVVCSIDTCPVQFDVALQSPTGYFEVVHVTVKITDINDNRPWFPKPRVTIMIPENSMRNDTFRISGASDADSDPRFGIQSYVLKKSGGHVFSIRRIDNADGTTDVGIVLIGVIDRETKPTKYHLVVEAIDGGRPPKSGSVAVNVIIGDANDHTPVFDKRVYNVSIDENTAVNSPVITIRATDKDLGLNALMVYKFTPKTLASYGHLFSLNETTGAITVSGELDYEATSPKKLFQLSVQASDRGNQPKTSKTLVIVNLRDKNDNAPTIKFNLLAGHGYSIVSENAQNGAYVGHVSVFDPDNNGKQKVLCRIKNPTFLLQHMSGDNSYKIVVNAPLNREFISEYDITVSCEDTGFPRKLASASLRVLIKDENDHRPVFKPKTYQISLAENYELNKVILQVSATDQDIGLNGKIMYEIDPKVQPLLRVESVTGKLYAIDTLDRETYPVLIFRIWAKDHGVPQKSAFANVIITLLDENDVTPLFHKDIYSFRVTEDTFAGAVIGNVSATDDDTGPGGEFVYHIVAQTNPDDAFSISATGVISAMMEFDRETKSSYQLLITATDKGLYPLTGTATVILTVEDVNDNAPHVTFPNTFNNTVNIPHTLKKGSVVVNISASDRDAGDNGRLTYQILHVKNRNYKNIFRLDNATGVLSITTDLHLYHADNYELVISVSDHGAPPRATITNLNIRVFILNNTDIAVGGSGRSGLSRNSIIIMALAIVTVLLIAIIIAAIAIIKKKDVRKHNYRAKSEEQKIIRQSGNMSSTSSASPSDNSILDAKAVKIFPQACSSLINNSTASSGHDGRMARVDHGHVKAVRGEREYMQMIEEDSERNKSKSLGDSGVNKKLDDTISDDSQDTTVTNDSGQGGSEDDICTTQKSGFYLREKDRIVQRLSSDHYDDRYHGGCYRYPSSDIDGSEGVAHNPRGDGEFYDMSVIHERPKSRVSGSLTNNLTQTPATGQHPRAVQRCFNRNIDLSTDSVNANTRNGKHCGAKQVNSVGAAGERLHERLHPHANITQCRSVDYVGHQRAGNYPNAYYNEFRVTRDVNSIPPHTTHSQISPTKAAKHRSRSKLTPDNRALNRSLQGYNMTPDSDSVQVYSIADIDGLVDSRVAMSRDDDAATTTSGSYTINPDELVNEIDDLFFKDVIV